MNDLNKRGGLSLTLELDEPREVDPDHEVELNVSAKTNVPSSWRVSLKVNHQCVDGIDFHTHEVKGADGRPLKGWHRHVYDETSGDADRNRVPIDDPAPDHKIRTFIESVLKLMNVYIDAEAIHGQPELEFDP